METYLETSYEQRDHKNQSLFSTKRLLYRQDKRARYEISTGNCNNTETWSANLHMTGLSPVASTDERPETFENVGRTHRKCQTIFTRNTIAIRRTSPAVSCHRPITLQIDPLLIALDLEVSAKRTPLATKNESVSTVTVDGWLADHHVPSLYLDGAPLRYRLRPYCSTQGTSRNCTPRRPKTGLYAELVCRWQEGEVRDESQRDVENIPTPVCPLPPYKINC